MDLIGARRRSRPGGRRRRREGEREHRAHRRPTLFAREHNRIVRRCRRRSAEELKFQIARRVVGAEIQYITYTRVPSRARRGPRRRTAATSPDVERDAGQRVRDGRLPGAQHGPRRVRADVDAREYTPAQLDAFRGAGIECRATTAGTSTLVDTARASRSATRTCWSRSAIGAVLAEPRRGAQYKNDEQIDNSLRSVLFQVPKPGDDRPEACLTPTVDPPASPASRTWARSTSRAAATTGCRATTRCARAYGLAHEDARSPRSRASDRAFPTIDPNKPRRSSTSRRCATPTATRSRWAR